MTWKDKLIKPRKLTCWYQQGKVCYDKKSALTAINLRYKEDHVRLRSYWCDKCNFWHITKNLSNYFTQNLMTETITPNPSTDETTSPPDVVVITDLPEDTVIATPPVTEPDPIA